MALLPGLGSNGTPFGTAENYYQTFGVKDIDYSMSGGQAARTDRGRTEAQLPLGFIASQPPALYAAGLAKDHNLRLQAYMDKVIPTGSRNPVATTYSESNSTKRVTILKAFTDSVNDIIQGRRPFSQLKSVVDQWRTSGGDKIRSEYEKQLQSAP